MRSESARSPGSDSVETHLDAHLRSGRVDDEIDGSGATSGDAASEEEVGGCAEGILWARLVGLLLDLKGLSVVVNAVAFVGDADPNAEADAEWRVPFHLQECRYQSRRSSLQSLVDPG